MISFFNHLKSDFLIRTLVIGLIISTSTHAQELDPSDVSIKKTQNESSKLFSFIYKSKQHLEKNHLDSAEFYIDQAGEILKNKPWPEKYSEQLFKVTRNLYNASFYTKSISKTQRFIANYDKHNSDYYMYQCLQMNASSHMYQGDFETAEIGFEKYLNFIETLDDTKYSKNELINIRTAYFFNKGISQAIQGNYNQSLKWFEKGDSILQHGGSMLNKLNGLTYMGNINMELNNYEIAINYFKKVEKSYLEGEKVDMLAVFDNLAVCYTMLGNFDEADKYLRQNLTLARSLGDSVTVGYNFLNQAQIHEAKKSYRKAIDKLGYALLVFDYVNNDVLIYQTKLRIVSLTNYAGLSERKHLKMIEEVIDYYSTTNIREKQLLAYKHKAKTLYNLGEYKAAAELFNYHDSIHKEWLLENFNEKTADLESNYRANYYKLESENKAQYAEILEQKNERSSSILYFVSGALILFVVASILFWMLNYKLRDSRKKVAEQNITLEKRNHEKSLLLKELHHRVKNNLQIVSSLLNLQSIAVKDESAQNAFKDGQNRVDAMAMIHKYLYTSDELTHVDIQSYLSRLVESIAYSYNFNKKNIAYKFNITSSPLDVDIAIPLGLIANELVSNAFKHAFVNMENPELSVNLTLNEKLVFEVKDNGKGLPATTKNEDSFGMELVHSLMAQLNAQLEYTYENGACFRLIMPLSTFKTSEI